ncbi:hypothetical protein [Flavobacterium sp.]|uniref:hypothetical protein n=1 Tax=Flavobacterium sp. TaxID=239 RepID=UPI002FDDFBCE
MKKIILGLAIILFILFFLRNYTKTREDNINQYNFIVSKIKIRDNGSILINDTFYSPNFMLTKGYDIKINDSIVKPSKSREMYVYRKENSNYKLFLTIKSKK